MKIKRHEFLEETIYLIRKLLETKLPKEATLVKMLKKSKKLLLKFIEKRG